MNGFEETKMRGEVQIGLLPVPGTPPVEWLESPDPVDYQTALAVMAERAAAIARGEARELVWLLEHPALYTAGTSSRPHELIDARFPVYQTGRGGQFTYHGPGQRVAYLMLDLKRRAPDVRRFVATVEEWIIRTLGALGVTGERRATASVFGSGAADATATPKTKSLRSGCASGNGSRCMALRSTLRPTCRISPASCPAGFPTRVTE